MKEYTCEVCNNTYDCDSNWTDEDAKNNELYDIGREEDEDAVVCDDCYKILSKEYSQLTPEEINKVREAYYARKN